MKLILKPYNTSETVTSKIKKSDTTSDFQFYLMVVEWSSLENAKLLKDKDNYIEFQKDKDSTTGVVSLIKNGLKQVHKFSYKKMEEVTNAFSIYRIDEEEFIETFHLVSPEDYEILASGPDHVEFPGSFNEQRLLHMDLEKSAEKNTTRALVFGIIVFLIVVIRFIMKMAR